MRKLNTGTITTEKQLAARILNVLCPNYETKHDRCGTHWQRIEATTMLGIPDVNVCCHTYGEAWIELKVRASYSRKITFQPNQKAWWIKAAQAERKGAVLAYNRKTADVTFLKWSFYTNDFQAVDQIQFDHSRFIGRIFSSCHAGF